MLRDIRLQHEWRSEEEWVTGAGEAGELPGHPDVSSVADLNASVQSVLDMHIVPLNFAAVLQILVAATAPFLVVVASQVPLTEILKWLLGVIL